MNKAKWVIGIKTSSPLYILEAEIELECHECERKIEKGEIFSRSSDKKGTVGGIRYTFCNRCRQI